MRFLKNNQVIIYVIALMLVTAGYLNYNSNNSVIETSTIASENNTRDDSTIGDATLVSSNAIVKDEDDSSEEIPSSNEIAQANSNDYNHNDEYFSKSKLEREKMYSQTIETYQKILDNSNVSEEQKKVATQEITNKNNEKNSIMICESLLETKGFDNCVIFVNNSSVSVVIDAQELKQEDVAQIQNIVSREMKVEAENIHITNK